MHEKLKSEKQKKKAPKENVFHGSSLELDEE